jgi:hypothetical protein
MAREFLKSLFSLRKPTEEMENAFFIRIIGCFVFSALVFLPVGFILEKYQYDLAIQACNQGVGNNLTCEYYQMARENPGKQIYFLNVPCALFNHSNNGSCIVMAVRVDENWT